MIEGFDAFVIEGQELLKSPGAGYITHKHSDFER